MNPHANTSWQAHGISEKRMNELSDLVDFMRRPADELDKIQWSVMIEATAQSPEERLWLTEQIFFKLGMLAERSQSPKRVFIMGTLVKD